MYNEKRGDIGENFLKSARGDVIVSCTIKRAETSVKTS